MNRCVSSYGLGLKIVPIALLKMGRRAIQSFERYETASQPRQRSRTAKGLGISFMILLVQAALPLRGTTITFDDLAPTPLSGIPRPYHGLIFSASPYDGIESHNPTNPGVLNGVVSGSNVLVTDPQGLSFQSPDVGGVIDPFTFNSGYFTAASNDGLTIKIEGTRYGAVVGSTNVVLNTSGPKFLAFGWAGIDEVQLSVVDGGTPGQYDSNPRIVIDNLDVDTAPEPATFFLMGGSLIVVAILVRHGRRKGRPVQHQSES